MDILYPFWLLCILQGIIQYACMSDWYKWTHSKDSGASRIRRYRKVDGVVHWQTYPKAEYRDLNKQQIEALLRRLNTSLEIERREAEARYDFSHAYINKAIVESFERKVRTEATSESHIKSVTSILNKYVLEFFVFRIKQPDPNKWKRYEEDFGQHLLKLRFGASFCKAIIQVANRFLKFLHDKYQDEVKLVVLEPLSKNVLKALRANIPKRNKFINTEDFERICKEVDSELVPFIKLGYYLGLRCAEVLGLQKDDVFEDHVSIERQLRKLYPPTYSKLKNKELREVPLWFCSPKEIYSLIQQPIHPNTLSRRFSDEMKRLGLHYQFHDLRRTWITRALRVQHYLDVKLAAGHSDLETTNKYIQDDRQLQRKKYVPSVGLHVL